MYDLEKKNKIIKKKNATIYITIIICLRRRVYIGTGNGKYDLYAVSAFLGVAARTACVRIRSVESGEENKEEKNSEKRQEIFRYRRNVLELSNGF